MNIQLHLNFKYLITKLQICMYKLQVYTANIIYIISILDYIYFTTFIIFYKLLTLTNYKRIKIKFLSQNCPKNYLCALKVLKIIHSKC